MATVLKNGLSPFKVIDEAVNAIISGKSIEYNSQFKQIIYIEA